MKKYTLPLCLLALMLVLTSCMRIELKDPPSPSQSVTSSNTTASTTEAPTTEPEPAPTEPPLPSFDTPLWTGADETAQTFLQSDTVVDCSKREYSYSEMEEDLQMLAAVYPTRFSYRSFGKTVLGRNLYVAILGNPAASKQILVSAGIHGREYLTPLLAMKQIEFYLAYYDSGIYQEQSYASLFENVCFYIVPMTNPDGIMLSQGGIDTVSDSAVKQQIIHTYSRDFNEHYTNQTQINEYLKIWKANANGVDLNRNYNALWEEYDGIDRPSLRNYKGPAPESEPETRAMVALANSIPNVQAVICLHSQGEVLYWNCGQETELRDETLRFTQSVSDANGYLIITKQNNDASLSDWCALKRNLIAITVETGVDACPLPITQFPTIWTQNYDLLALSAKYFG